MQADTDQISVSIKTGPTDADNTYLCETEGMLQWHAQITYTAADATARETTPAVMAAQATDYVSYSAIEFKTFLTSNINDEVSGGVPAAVFVGTELTVSGVARPEFQRLQLADTCTQD